VPERKGFGFYLPDDREKISQTICNEAITRSTRFLDFAATLGTPSGSATPIPIAFACTVIKTMSVAG
jgi:hypothetical protein